MGKDFIDFSPRVFTPTLETKGLQMVLIRSLALTGIPNNKLGTLDGVRRRCPEDCRTQLDNYILMLCKLQSLMKIVIIIPFNPP